MSVTGQQLADEYESLFRQKILNVALAARVGEEGDLRMAVDILLESILELAEKAYAAGKKSASVS